MIMRMPHAAAAQAMCASRARVGPHGCKTLGHFPSFSAIFLLFPGHFPSSRRAAPRQFGRAARARADRCTRRPRADGDSQRMLMCRPRGAPWLAACGAMCSRQTSQACGAMCSGQTSQACDAKAHMLACEPARPPGLSMQAWMLTLGNVARPMRPVSPASRGFPLRRAMGKAGRAKAHGTCQRLLPRRCHTHPSTRVAHSACAVAVPPGRV